MALGDTCVTPCVTHVSPPPVCVRPRSAPCARWSLATPRRHPLPRAVCPPPPRGDVGQRDGASRVPWPWPRARLAFPCPPPRWHRPRDQQKPRTPEALTALRVPTANAVATLPCATWSTGPGVKWPLGSHPSAPPQGQAVPGELAGGCWPRAPPGRAICRANRWGLQTDGCSPGASGWGSRGRGRCLGSRGSPAMVVPLRGTQPGAGGHLGENFAWGDQCSRSRPMPRSCRCHRRTGDSDTHGQRLEDPP